MFLMTACDTDAPFTDDLTPDDIVMNAPGDVKPGSDTGNDKALDPDPETDCKCYMRIDQVTGSGLWTLEDITVSQGGYMATGITSFWSPTGFEELDTPSNGIHQFLLSTSSQEIENLRVHTTVQCKIQENDGTETLATTTSHIFNGSEGTPVLFDDEYGFAVEIYKEFSCLYLPIGGGKN